MGRPAGAASSSRLPGTWIQLALASVAVFAVAYIIHQPSVRFGFLTSWDDPTYVTDNPWIRGLTAENIKFAFTTPYFANYLPLHLVSYMVDYSLWGLNPFGFHLQSVILAALNAVLAFFVVRRLIGSFALGRSGVGAVGVVNLDHGTDRSGEENRTARAVEELRAARAIKEVKLVTLGPAAE